MSASSWIDDDLKEANYVEPENQIQNSLVSIEETKSDEGSPEKETFTHPFAGVGEKTIKSEIKRVHPLSKTETISPIWRLTVNLTPQVEKPLSKS